MLNGKTALITGSSRGIGKSIALELAKNKSNVVINYTKGRNQAQEVIDEIKKLDAEYALVKADVSKFFEVKTMCNLIGKRFGQLDILVNNAGIILDKTLRNMGPEMWEKMVDINLTGVFNVTKNAMPLIEDGGRIINISSITGLDGNFGQTNYAASKAGVIGFTKSLAKELSKRKITVNAVAPGFIKTTISDNIPIESKNLFESRIALGEFGMPEDVANAVAFLASDNARYITGEVLRVDGGLNL